MLSLFSFFIFLFFVFSPFIYFCCNRWWLADEKIYINTTLPEYYESITIINIINFVFNEVLIIVIIIVGEWKLYKFGPKFGHSCFEIIRKLKPMRSLSLSGTQLCSFSDIFANSYNYFWKMSVAREQLLETSSSVSLGYVQRKTCIMNSC